MRRLTLQRPGGPHLVCTEPGRLPAPVAAGPSQGARSFAGQLRRSHSRGGQQGGALQGRGEGSRVWMVMQMVNSDPVSLFGRSPGVQPMNSGVKDLLGRLRDDLVGVRRVRGGQSVFSCVHGGRREMHERCTPPHRLWSMLWTTGGLKRSPFG